MLTSGVCHGHSKSVGEVYQPLPVRGHETTLVLRQLVFRHGDIGDADPPPRFSFCQSASSKPKSAGAVPASKLTGGLRTRASPEGRHMTPDNAAPLNSAPRGLKVRSQHGALKRRANARRPPESPQRNPA